MTTFVQLHLLTAFPASNLNRDDTGRPKSVVLGGASRLRISSQSLKRAWRVAWRETSDFQARLAGKLGERTQRMGETVEKALKAQGVPNDKALAAARAVAACFGKVKPVGAQIEQLAFIPPAERAAALATAERIAAGEDDDTALESILTRADTAIDIALFGRMLADAPEYNREAAAQVAHAFTTHAARIEDDYYTAVDDLQRPEDAAGAGAGFVGELGFGAGLFYLYVCIDRDLLIRNLGGDQALADEAIQCLLEAASKVAPRGKQASFASRARALYVMAEKGEAQPRTLAGAFLKPIHGQDQLEASIRELEAHRAALAAAYGDEQACRVMQVGVENGQTLQTLVAFCRGA